MIIYGLHIRLGALFRTVALERNRCFFLSQVARDVQQVQETTNSPLLANGLVSCGQVKMVRLRETMNGLATSCQLPAVCYERRA